jgi:hypothetical protein
VHAGRDLVELGRISHEDAFFPDGTSGGNVALRGLENKEQEPGTR